MTAQEIIEKIRAEVERLIRESDGSQWGLGKMSACNRILNFLDTLQEQPVKIDIRKELASIEFMGVNDARDTETIARHFYELGRQSKPTTAEGLEDEIERWFEEIDKYTPFNFTDIGNTARHFAQWQKEQMISALKIGGDLPIEFIDKFHEIDRTAFQNGQANMRENMMKEAVEGEVVTTNKYTSVRYLSRYGTFRYFYGIGGGFQKGDKVKLIIVKED